MMQITLYCVYVFTCRAAASTAHGYAVVDLAKGALVCSKCTLTFPAEPSAADASTCSFSIEIFSHFEALSFDPHSSDFLSHAFVFSIVADHSIM